MEQPARIAHPVRLDAIKVVLAAEHLGEVADVAGTGVLGLLP